MFHIGQKVVCIQDVWVSGEPTQEPPGIIKPSVGDVLTIREMVRQDGVLYFKFAEIHNKPFGGYLETVFEAIGFRPVVEKKTDISVFTAMLNKSPTKNAAALNTTGGR